MKSVLTPSPLLTFIPALSPQQQKVFSSRSSNLDVKKYESGKLLFLAYVEARSSNHQSERYKNFTLEFSQLDYLSKVLKISSLKYYRDIKSLLIGGQADGGIKDDIRFQNFNIDQVIKQLQDLAQGRKVTLAKAEVKAKKSPQQKQTIQQPQTATKHEKINNLLQPQTQLIKSKKNPQYKQQKITRNRITRNSPTEKQQNYRRQQEKIQNKKDQLKTKNQIVIQQQQKKEDQRRVKTQFQRTSSQPANLIKSETRFLARTKEDKQAQVKNSSNRNEQNKSKALQSKVAVQQQKKDMKVTIKLKVEAKTATINTKRSSNIKTIPQADEQETQTMNLPSYNFLKLIKVEDSQKKIPLAMKSDRVMGSNQNQPKSNFEAKIKQNLSVKSFGKSTKLSNLQENNLYHRRYSWGAAYQKQKSQSQKLKKQSSEQHQTSKNYVSSKLVSKSSEKVVKKSSKKNPGLIQSICSKIFDCLRSLVQQKKKEKKQKMKKENDEEKEQLMSKTTNKNQGWQSNRSQANIPVTRKLVYK